MAQKILLKDQLFNTQSVGQLAAEYAGAVRGFDAARFTARALAGFPERELMARIGWLADCLQEQLSPDFPTMADQIEAALPRRLDPSLSDDDFGQFIHATAGVLAVRHGLEMHRARAMRVIYEATQRFSMEFYIRAFLIRWPHETLAQLADWTGDPNYHVRRLVSEGTRPRLPWAQGVGLLPAQTFPLLDRLCADPTRYVTRSVANHLNDLSKTCPDDVLERLARWRKDARQDPKEAAWMRRHALRTLIKQGHEGAMAALGYSAEAPVEVQLLVDETRFAIGETLTFEVALLSPADLPVLLDYRISFARAGDKRAQKVFKIKTTTLRAGTPLRIQKSHRFRGDASTFTLHPGAHRITIQLNGRDVARADFTLTD